MNLFGTILNDVRRLSAPMCVFLFSVFLNRIGSVVLLFLALYLTRSEGLSFGQVGWIIAVIGGTGVIASPLAGRLSDRFGAVPVVQGSLFANGLAFLAFPFVHGFVPLLVLAFVTALASEAYRPASWALMGQMVPANERRFAFSIQRLVVNLAMSIGPIVGGFLAAKNYTYLFVMDGMTCLLSALFFFHAAFKGLGSPSSQSRSMQLSRMFHAGWEDERLRFFLICLVPAAAIFFLGNTVSPLFVTRELGFSEQTFGLVYAINPVLVILTQLPITTATKHWSAARALALGSLLIGVGFGSLAWVSGIVTLLCNIVVWTVGEMIMFPVASAFVSEIAPQGRDGEYMGLFGMAINLAVTVGPWLGLQVLDRSSWMAVCALTATVGIGSAAAFLKFEVGAPRKI